MAGGRPLEDAAMAASPKPGAASKPTIDWSARYRTTRLDVQRYSRFVGIMKRALLMAAAALLAALLAYSLQPRLQTSRKLALTMQKVGFLNHDLMMTKPKLTGTDGDGNPYVVTADEAIQDPRDNKRAQLMHVQADMTLRDGQWLNLTATRGWLDETKQMLRLEGTIDVYSDNGYEVHTTLADVNLRSGLVVGNKPVRGQGPLGTFRSDKFRMERGTPHAPKQMRSSTANDETKIYLYGHVEMTIYKSGIAHS